MSERVGEGSAGGYGVEVVVGLRCERKEKVRREEERDRRCERNCVKREEARDRR